MYRILFTFIFLINLTSGSATPDAHEPPFPFAPLGGVWVKKLPPQYQRFHSEIVGVELGRSHSSDKQFVIDGSGSIPTNFAYFKLRLYLQSTDDTVETVDLLEHFFKLDYKSGGYILPDSQEPRLFPLVLEKEKLVEDRKRHTASITDKITALSKLSNLVGSPSDLMRKLQAVPEEISRSIKLLEEVKEKLGRLTKLEQSFEEGSSVFAKKKTIYSDFKRQMYDPEQIIARLIDDYLMKAKLDAENIVLCEKSVPLAKVIRIGIHIHSRLDLCPYCVMFLHEKTKQWNEHILRITGKSIVSTFVSSRQEYISSSPFLLTQPFFKGSSMRYIGLSEEHFNSPLSEEKLSDYSNKGIIIQFLFLAHEISL